MLNKPVSQSDKVNAKTFFGYHVDDYTFSTEEARPIEKNMSSNRKLLKQLHTKDTYAFASEQVSEDLIRSEVQQRISQLASIF